MKIPTNIKPKLNTLISYYRNLYSKTDERFMSKNFIYDDEGLEICTIHTLSRIEHNKTNSYDNIYYSLLDNLHTSYINEPKVDEIIHAVNLSLLKLAERNDSKLIIDRISKTLNALSPYLDYIIYKEQAEVYQILLDYYQDYKFNTELIDKYNELFDIVDEPLKPILIEITATCYTRIYLNEKKSFSTMKLINKCHCDSVISDYINLLLNFREYRHTIEKSIGTKLIERCENENNKIYLCKTYNIIASLYTQQNPTLAISLLQNAIDSFDGDTDSIQSLETYLFNLVTLASMNNKFELAIKYFKELENINSLSIYKIFPYYVFSLEKANSPICDIINFLDTLKRNQKLIKNNILHSILCLLFIKYNLGKFSLNLPLSYLITEKDRLKNIQPLLTIIEFELYEICKRDDSFQTYKEFMKNFQ